MPSRRGTNSSLLMISNNKELEPNMREISPIVFSLAMTGTGEGKIELITEITSDTECSIPEQILIVFENELWLFIRLDMALITSEIKTK